MPEADPYVLAIGVSGYEDERLRLDYAATDAKDFGEAWRRCAGVDYRQAPTTMNPLGVATLYLASVAEQASPIRAAKPITPDIANKVD